MKPNEIYFDRNRGSWDWSVEFKIINYAGLWLSNLTLFSKFRISAFALTQKIFGPFQMWTNVDFVNGERKVLHSTKMKKWGFTFYQSQKTILLANDGYGLRLEGTEYFWPFSSRPVPFQPVFGSVDDSTTHASYQMPLAGTYCHCKTYLGQSDGYLEISTPWLKGRFKLLEGSLRVFASRFG